MAQIEILDDFKSSDIEILGDFSTGAASSVSPGGMTPERAVALFGKKEQPAAEKTGVSAGDYGRAAGAGALQGLGSIAEIGEQIFGVGEDLRDWSTTKADNLLAGMSPEAQQAMQKEIFTSTGDGALDVGFGDGAGDLNTWGLKLANTVGMQADIMIPGGIFAKGGRALLGVGSKALGQKAATLAAQNMARGMAKDAAITAAKKTVEKEARLKLGAAAMAGYGTAEAAVGAGATAIDVRQQVMSMPEPVLSESPEYRQALAQTGDPQAARAQVAEKAASAGAANVALPTFLFGAVAGKFYDDIFRGVGGSRLASAGKGAAVEALQEGPQSAAEHIGGRQALQEFADPTIDPYQGAGAAAAEGAALGALVGGGMGGAFHGAQETLPEDVNPDPVSPPQPPEPEAMIGQPPRDPPPAQPLDTFAGQIAEQNDARQAQIDAAMPSRQSIEVNPKLRQQTYPTRPFLVPRRQRVKNALDDFRAGRLSAEQYKATLSKIYGASTIPTDELEPVMVEQTVPPIPERADTIAAQIDAFTAGRKRAVLLTPGETVMDGLPEGAATTDLGDAGVLIHRADDQEAPQLAAAGRLGEVLDYGIEGKPAGATDVVTARDAQGRVVQDVATDGRPKVEAAAAQVAGPGGTVETRPADQALAERTQGATPVITGDMPVADEPIAQAAGEHSDKTSYLNYLRGRLGKAAFVNRQAEIMARWDETHPEEAIDQAAHEAATSPNNDRPEPTEAQKVAGNYKKGKVRIQGLDISIENPAGSVRSGTDETGKPWSQTMRNHYGYIVRVDNETAPRGKDKDHLDVFVGPQAENPDAPVTIIDQSDGNRKFDEHKIQIGFESEQSAIQGYLSNYEPGWDRIRGVKTMTVDQFKEWLASGKTKQPAASKILSRSESKALAEKYGKQATPQATQAAFKPTHELPDGTKVAANLGDDGQPITGEWVDADGSIIEDGNAEPITAEKPEKPKPFLQPRAEREQAEQTPPTGGVSVSEDENIRRGDEAMSGVIVDHVDAKHAMQRHDGSWVSFYWGNPGTPAKNFSDGSGVAKIMAKRTSEGADGSAVARKMVEVIARGREGSVYGPEGGRRVNVNYDGHTAVLSLHRFGKEETWLLTGWDDVQSDDASAVNAAGAYAQSPSGIRDTVGAGDKSVAKDDIARKSVTAGDEQRSPIKNKSSKQDQENKEENTDIQHSKADSVKNEGGDSLAVRDNKAASRVYGALALYIETPSSLPDAVPMRKLRAAAKINEKAAELLDFVKQAKKIGDGVLRKEGTDADVIAALADVQADKLNEYAALLERGLQAVDFEQDIKGMTDNLSPKEAADMVDELTQEPAINATPEQPALPQPPAPAIEESIDTKRARMDLDAALADLGSILLDRNTLKVVPVDEAKLLPVLTRVMDAAFRLGYHKFKDSARFVLKTIREKFGADAADAVTLDHLQGAYIGMAGKYPEADTKRAVVDVDSLDEIQAPEATTEEQGNDSRTGGTGEEALGGMAPAEDSSPESGGDVHAGDAEGGGESGDGNQELDEQRGAAPRSPGNRAPRVHSAEARTGRGGKSGRKGGKRGGGTGVSGYDATDDASGRVDQPNIPAANFVIDEELRLGKGGEVEKFRDNIAAIKTLKQIQAEQRRATPEEQRILARYVGWGGLANAFADDKGGFKDGWEGRGKELAELLADRELAAARASTRNAHYTSESVVRGMWDAVRHLGYRGGLALEPSAGTGNFIGMAPADLRNKFIAVEYDAITAGIAHAVYPQATVLHSGFQRVPLADGAFDLVIGNPPFGNESLNFQFKPEFNRKSIHNQFFLAGLDALKPGGIMPMVVSRYLLDAKDSEARIEMAKRGRLLGAIRLPDTAFKENARTEVVTDILFFQRYTAAEQAEIEQAFEQRGRQPSRGETENQRIERERLAALIPDWIDTTSLPDPLGGDAMTVNRYFAANPSMVLGTLERSGSMRYGADITVRLDKGEDIGAHLARAIARLPRNVVNQTDEAIAASIERHKSMADALEIALSGAEEGAVTRDLDGGMTQVVEKETPEGGYELSRRKLTPESPWSPQLYMDNKGRWFREVQKVDANGKAVKNGRFNVYERDIFETEADVPSHLRLGEARFKLLAQLVEMRDLLKQQLILETEDAPSKKIEENRKLLAKAYQDFVDKRGPINADRNAKLVSDMPDGALVLALEMSYRKEQKEWTGKMQGKTKVYKTVRPESATPAPILKDRVARPYEPPTRAESPADALGVSLAETGRINMARVADLLGKTEDEAIAELFESADEPLIFKDPETEQWETRDVYLTGHVRRKLHAARAAGLSKHIAALGKVQPDPIGAENITPNIGMSWIPADIYADFLHHLTGERTRVHYSAITNAYSVTGTGLTKQAKEWGTDRTTAFDLVDDILNSRQTRVYDRDSDGKQHLNQEQTDLANLKREQIAVEFSDWVFQQSERRNRLVDIFNEKFNTRVARQHNGSHLTFPGKVPDLVIQMRRHQKNAIWRGISERFTLYDHAVGAGKTYTAIARAMERRRMGLSRKPMIVVPNHMVEQFGADVYRLYPGAKVLAAGKKDFERKNRRKLFAKIATGDWDVVIVPHSSFERIQIAPETEERYLQAEIALAEKAIKEAEEQAAEDGNAGRRKPFNVKEAERVKASLEARLEKLKTRNKDRLLTFEQMGVDDLTVDEAHEFKNLFYSSRLTGVRGMGTKTGSQRAFDLYSKVRVLRDSPTGTVTFMTGTPISNSAVEMYTMMRYLAANELAELGLDHFDAWRAQFVGIKTKYEPTESGGLKEVNRLGRDWANMRSLMDLYYSFTDAVTNEDIKKAFAEDNPGQEFPLPKVKGGGRQSIVVKPTKAQEYILQTVIDGFDNLPNISDPYERNKARLRLMDRARKLSLDARAVDPHSTSDEKGGKLDMVADRVAAIYKDWAKHRGTQLIFLDRSVPKGKNDHKIIREYDGLVAERDKALADGDEEAFRKAEDKLEKFDQNEVEEMRNAQRGGWNAYKQIKENLIARGLKAEEVRFIQEANTDEQKQALFDAVNDGEIRVLIGSTPRMGAGTNVQQRLVALHHVDVTWKPSDIEQREGRIIRQGNKLYEQFTKKGDDFFVEINAYVTERTVDAKMWDLNATKLKMINAIRSYDGSFNMEFEDEDSVSMAEIAALATGDPLMMERIALMGDIDKLSLLERQHKRKQLGIKDSIRQAEKDVADLPAKIEQKKADAERFAKAIEAAETESGARRVTVEGAEYESAFDAETAAMDAIKAQQDGNENAKYAVSVNGSRLTNKADITKAIKMAIGDRGFVATINGKPYTEILEASRPIAEVATRMANDLLPGQAAQTETMGTLYGLKLELDANRSDYSKNFIFTLSLTDETGRVIVSDQLNPYEHPKPAPASFKNALSGLAQELKGITRPYGYQRLEQRLAEAQEDLPKLREKENAQFDRADELTAKRARLEEVTSTLAAKAAPAGAPVGGASGPVLSTAQELPEANWISAGETAQVVEEFATKFRHEVPVIVEDRPADVLGSAAGADDAAGMVWNGRVYVFRSGIPDRAELVSTLFHEFLHYGIRRFIPRQQYINTMRQLYEADAWIQDKTMDWVESPEGQALLAEGEERAYVVARGVDEALAELAEQIEGNPASFRHNGFMAKTIRAVSRWMAKVARRLGFTEAAARWEAVTNDEARRFIGRIFAKLREDPPAAEGVEGADMAFSRKGGDTFIQEVLAELADVDELFRYPVSKAGTLEGVMTEVFAGARYVGDDTRADEHEESGADRRIEFLSQRGKPFYVFERGADEVWIDVSRLEEGELGSGIYAAVANYAYNTGKVFIGDPNGLSEAAIVRRTSNMLSSALRFGTTRHLEAAPEQIRGVPEKGIAPLEWRGSDVDKVGSLIHTFLTTLQVQNPEIKDYRYDFRRREFVDKRGNVVTRGRFVAGSERRAARQSRAGHATLRRGILLQSLVSSPRSQRPGILEQVLNGSRSLVTQGGLEAVFRRRKASSQAVADIDTTLFDEFRFKAQDRFHYLNKLQKAAAAERGIQELPEGEDAYLAELRYHGMAGAAIEDFHREHVEPLMEAIADAKLTVDDVDLYLRARHAPEANAQLERINPDREDNQALSGMSNDEAAAVMAKFRADGHSDALNGIAERVDAITAARRRMLVEAGLETQETVDKWEETYRYYVPLKREGHVGQLPPRGKGFDTRGKEKRRAGSTKDVVHVLANVVAQYESTAVKAEKVKVGKAFLRFALNNSNPELYEVNKIEYKPTFDADGLVHYRPDTGYALADNVLVVRVDGVDHRITFNEVNPVAMRIAHALRNLGADEQGPIFNILSTLTRWLAIVNTGANPEFVISNFARDLQTAGYNLTATEADKLKWTIIKDVGKAWRGIRAFQKGKHHAWAPYFDEFRKAGAQTGWMEHYKTIEDREKALVRMIEQMGDTSTPAKIRQGLKAVIDFVEKENTAVENAVRLSAFVHARRAGLSEAKAARIAKEMTVNFNRRGDMGQVLNAVYLFYNASIQGTVRIFQAVKKSKKVRAMMAATVVFAAVLDMVNRAIGGDDDDGEPRYDKVPDFVKERNLIIMRDDGSYFKIPLPWGYNVLHVLGQTIGEAFTQRNWRPGKSAARVAAATLSAFNPIGGSESLLQFLSPTITDPLVQWAENKDWAGKPLRPASNPFGVDTPNSQKYWNSVRAPSKWFTDTMNELTGGDEVRPGAIDISPEAIDLMIDTFTGGAGRFLSDVVSTPAKALSDEPIESYEVPLLRKVYGAPGMGTVTQEFYERVEEVRLAEKQYKFYQGNADKLRELRAEYGVELSLIPAMKRIEKDMRLIRKHLKVAEKIDDQERVRMLREREAVLMKRFNGIYNSRMMKEAS